VEGGSPVSAEPIDLSPSDVELARRIAHIDAVNATRHPGGEMSYGNLLRIRDLAARDGWACAYCGVGLVLAPWQPAATVDHVMPKALGGNGRALSNMALACEPCNREKGESLPVKRWRPRIDRRHLVYSGPRALSYRVRLDWARP
jgi:hypothetical protein